MFEIEFQFRQDFNAYKKGKYNPAELLFLTCHTLKDFQFYDKANKELVRLIREAVQQATWRDDLYIYDEWSRQAHFSFLSEFDHHSKANEKEELDVDADSIVYANYAPIDIADKIYMKWNRICDHPCLYGALAHLIEASADLVKPEGFEQRLCAFIFKASKNYDASQEKEQTLSKKMEECNMIAAYAYSLMGLDADKGSSSSPVEGHDG